MAAAFKNALAHPIHGNKRNSQYRPPPVNEEQKEREKRFILDFQNKNASACPDSNTSDVKGKALGAASKQLKIQDFELVKTLGTGKLSESQLSVQSAEAFTLLRHICPSMALAFQGTDHRMQKQGLRSQDPSQD